MTVNAVMVSHKPVRIYMDVLILGIKLQYMVSASLGYLLSSVRVNPFTAKNPVKN